LYKNCVAAKFVQRLSTDDQKEQRVTICQELLYPANDEETFLKNIRTGEETWVYGYDFDEKTDLTRDIENFPRPKKALQVLSNCKVVLIIYVGYKEVEHVFKGRQLKGRFIWKF
jgi:hypothetical protein